jgi:hypothetical protein
MTEPNVPSPPTDPSVAAQKAKGAALVKASRLMLLGGALVMAVGLGLLCFVYPPIGGPLLGVGFAVIIGAAVVGQVGRALQGRVI